MMEALYGGERVREEAGSEKMTGLRIDGTARGTLSS